VAEPYRYRMHAKYVGSGILGRVGSVVFFLGYIRQKNVWLGGAGGRDDYMYTFVLDVNQYGVFLYSMCNDIVRAHILCFL